MQSDPCGEASPKTGEGMRPLFKQGKSMLQFLNRRLRDLSHGRQGAPEPVHEVGWQTFAGGIKHAEITEQAGLGSRRFTADRLREVAALLERLTCA